METDNAVEKWRIKKLIDSLSKARGNGTSMISLIIPPREQISRISKMLSEEHGTATNIKSRVNRLSVLSAITSAQQRLKLYRMTPPNGLLIYVGTVITDEGKEKKVSIDFEPFKPINASLYLCDNKFHTEALMELLDDEETYGFIIMDGDGTLFGTLSGNVKTTLHRYTVSLPKKTRRGGQSAARFGRIRDEKRGAYVKKIGEKCTQFYIVENKPNVNGLILAGNAEFKNDLYKSDHLDPRLKGIVIDIIDVSYGEENGFNEAIVAASEKLSNVKYVRESRLLSSYFSEIAKDSGKICYGLQHTMYALEIGAAETIIVWENLPILRVQTNGGKGEKELVEYLTPQAAGLCQPESSTERIEKILLVEWLADNYQRYGSALQFITDCSDEGSQFCKGIGGIGAFLRYPVNFDDLELDEEAESESDDLLDESEEIFI